MKRVLEDVGVEVLDRREDRQARPRPSGTGRATRRPAPARASSVDVTNGSSGSGHHLVVGRRVRLGIGGLLRDARRTAVRSDQVDDREQDDPDEVDEVPVEARPARPGCSVLGV